MPQKTNLNVNPYYEDFDASKNFYKILFRPGYSIQGRELTQVQSILQNQLESFGKYAFKQGEQVIPGEVGLNTKLDYVKLSSVSEVAISEGDSLVYKKYDISQLVGQQLRGLTSGVLANVLATKLATEATADTIFVSYLNSGNSNTEPTFRQGETLEVVDGINTPLLVVGTDGSVLPTSIDVTNPDTGETTSLESPAMGFGSAVKVEEGIYFVNGYFVRNDEQLLVIDEYYDKPSAKVGFTIKEEIVTPEADVSLYDNAIGSSNYTAPGAHRLKIGLEIKEFALGAITDKNFIQLLTVKRGVVQRKVSPSDFSVLEQTLARRTFDESGDYVVDNFSVDMREWAQKDNNKGIYGADEFGLYNGYTASEASRKMVASIGPGKAYVKGYEIVNKETKYLEINKARESLSTDNVTLKTRGLPSLNVTNVYGSIPLNKEGSDLTAYPDVFLYQTFTDGSIGLNGTEGSTDHRQTIARRGLSFTPNDAIRTITIKVNGLNGQPTLGSITDANFQTDYDEIYFIKTRLDNGFGQSVGSVKTLSFATINRPGIDSNVNQQFLELTVFGNKAEIENLLIDYDDSDPTKKRTLFLSESDALSQADPFPYWGEIVDYRNSITPVIGKVKPSNFSLEQRGAGFNSDSDIILSKGRLAGGAATYNSIFKFAYFDPQFFTKILLESEPTPDAFEEGKYIFGLDSGAYGVIEGTASGVYSTDNQLFVKTISGEFKSGETIRSESGETVKVAKDNTISHFITLKRGSGYTSGATVQLNGVTYDSSKLEAVVYGSAVYKVDINNRNALRNIEFSQPPEVVIAGSGDSSGAAEVRAVLFRNSVTTYTPNNVKSIGSSYGSGGGNKFSGDLVVDNQEYSEISNVTDFTFFGTKGTMFVESTSFSANAAGLLLPGDLVQFSDDDNNLVRAIVEYATTPAGSAKTRIYLDTALPGNVTNTSIVRLRPKSVNTTSGTLLFPTGSKQVEKISAGGDDTKIKYYFRRDFVTTASSSGGLITFAAQLPFGTQRFAAFTEANYIVTVLDPGDAPNIAKGDIIYIPEDSVSITSATDTASGLTSGSISLSLSEGYFGTIPSNGDFPKLKLTATLEVSNAKPRLKTAVRNKRIVVTASGDRVIPLRGTDYDTEVIETLSYSDVFKLRYVYEGTPSQPPEVDTAGNLVSGTDVTSRYTFDDGQRDTVYEVSRIVLKPGFESAGGQLVIAFDYFQQSQGDFVTIDSYLHEAGVTEDEIPSFNSAVLGNIELKNVIDFRPKVDVNAIIPGYLDKSLLEVTEGSFAGNGSVIASTPAPDSNLEYTFSFSQVQYLDRIDGVFLTQKGDFVVKEGNSSLNPTKPDPIEDAVALFYAYIPAYTKTSKDVRITPVDNRRYTMRDIGKLEKRIERLEYYTTLSILEQQALNMQVKDSVGLDRFKSGFFVDNFEAHRGNLKSLDHVCAIDPQQSVLRPQSKEDSLSLVEINTREDQRAVSGYKKTGSLVSLPYTDLELLGNPSASKELNPNPFVVLQYVGDGEVSPSIDQWYDQKEEPIIVDTNTTLFNIFLAKDSVEEAFSSIHNSFVVNWVGTAPSFTAINSLGEINTQQANATVESAAISSSSNISPQNNDIGKGVQSKTVNGNIVSTALSFYARSIPVKFVIRRMKPNTRMYVFLEGRKIDRWVNPDLRFTGIAGNSLSAFNGPITTDEYGNASGLIILPAGYPPLENATWTGDIDTVGYDTDAEEVSITSGILTFRFTSSSSNEAKEDVDSYTEVKYYATGVLPENPSSIVSTRPSYFKSNEGVQLIESNTDNPVRPNPLAQTFKVENLEGGCFITGLDLFFSKKSTNVPIKTYITNVDAEKPGKNIVPGSEKTLPPNTFLKCYANGDVAVYKGENVTGLSSAASGPILQIFDKNNVELVATASGKYSLTNEQVYTVVLSNHNGKSFVQNEDLSIPSVTLANATDGTNLKLTIAKDSGKLSDIKVTNPGQNYDSAILTIESPQLPGGSTATARVEVSGGKIYNTEISLSGFGYTEPPSVVVKGIGNGAGGCEIQTFIEIDTPAVRMGVAIDREGVTNSTTPTNFKFDYPVYLQNDTEYALVVETDSTDYKLWASRLGETDIATSTVITTQPALGSVYKSQNTESWQEDIFEDLKFKMYRAEFDITRPATLKLKNKSLGYELLKPNPFETNASANSNANSLLFKNNNGILKVSHRDNGFEDSGKSYVYYRSAKETGGITSAALNSTLFQITNSGIDTYNITSVTDASANSFGGGDNVYATYNRKFETLYPQVGYLTFTGTKLDCSVKTTDVIPVDSTTTNYNSYDQTEFEKAFLNEPQYFTNQKMIASDINETLNNITDGSLQYQMVISSTVSHLSPVVDLGNATVKTSSSRIENASGKEDRFGRRDQVVKFYPIYQFQLAGGTEIQANQTIQGQTTKASGTIARINGAVVYVKVKTQQFFQKGETVTLGNQLSQTSVTVDSNPSELFFDIDDGATIIARNPSNIAQTYDNKITGKAVIWNSKTQELRVRTDVQPLANDYTGRIVDNALFSRNSVVADQVADIFRVGDIISYPNQPAEEAGYLEVGTLTYSNGIDFVAEDTSKNSSSAAKYVTKEIGISNPGTSIDVRLTVNVKETENIRVLYRIKKASSQENFDDIDWVYFNTDGSPDVLELATSENSISGTVEKQSSYQEFKYSVSDLPEFSSFGVKIVMKSVDPAFAPKVQDIRAVASF